MGNGVILREINNEILTKTLDSWGLGGKGVSASPYGDGHINNTFLVIADDEKKTRYILQRINRNVFKNPEKLMGNILLVTEYLKKIISANGGNPKRETLNVIPTIGGDSYLIDDGGDYWRMYLFVEDTICLQKAETPEDFYASAMAFGKFQSMLKDFPADKLYEVIPKFHDTRDRIDKFKDMLKNDPLKRAENVKKETEFVLSRCDEYSRIIDLIAAGKIPLKVTHNDTKLNNVLFDHKTREGICVIDLDTVMPGSAVNDFGDSIRFGANYSDEDEKDLSKVNFDLSLYKTYTEGFLLKATESLNDYEKENLAWSARTMTFECGVRFLTDYLDGDNYFKTKYPDHNLDRCRTQFKLVSDMEKMFEDMEKIVFETLENIAGKENN